MTRATLTVLILLSGCTDDPCAEYVSYMCDCHPDEASCSDLQTIYSDADADLQEECAIALDDQIDEDDDAGLVCGGDTGDTGA